MKDVNVKVLEGTPKLAEVVKKVNELIEVLNKMPAPRDRGPKSQREMSEDDARRLLLGNLKEVAHKAAAEELGLSYGQVYSARNGYTFKGVYDEYSKSLKK